MSGCCFWFATILSIRFGGETIYSPIENHFVQKINDRLYDVRGDVTDLYNGQPLYSWAGYGNVDSLDHVRVYRDCVIKATLDK